MQAGGQALEEFTVRPWPEQRARRTRWMGLAVLVLAPIVATVITWSGVASDTTSTVVEPAGIVEDDMLFIEATATNMDLQRNEMSFRLVFRPSGSLTDGTRLQDDVTVVVSDLSGATTRTFDAGTVMEPTTVVVGLTGSQLRYPFDTYDAQLSAGALLGTVRSQEPLPLDMSVGVALDQFTVEAQAERTPNTATIDLEMGRRTAVIIWVLFFISLVWMIALSSAAIAWFIVVFAKDPPFWVYALFASILFALPTLRAGLPGSPPYGSLVDWAAFYWGIAIVAGGLIALMVVWNVEARVAIRQARRREDHSGESDDPDGRD
ncbi:MAG: DUF4436 family protein [Microthrixaceae bacterium]